MSKNLANDISERAARDQDFRRRLKSDPRGVLEEELRAASGDARLPDSVDVQVIEQSANTVYIFVPNDDAASAPSGAAESSVTDDVSGSWVSVSFLNKPCKCV